MLRTTRTLRRPAPHAWDPDPNVPGFGRCGLPERNEAHDPARLAELHEGQDEHRRRTGETT